MSICIAFIANAEKANANSVQTEAIRLARSNGFHCLTIEPFKNDFKQADLPHIDLLVAIGGDGTILQAVPFAAAYDIPILGINTGRVGFLSEISPSELPEILPLLANQEYTIQTRMMVSCSVNNSIVCSALNEILIYKQTVSGVMHVEIYLDNTEAGVVSCDGLIVSSPTGSTGYSISAGGPIIAPNLDVCVITAICPHSLSAKPIVVAPDTDICVRAQNNGIVYADGMKIMDVTKDDALHITRSRQCVKFLSVKKGNLYSLIREKLI